MDIRLENDDSNNLEEQKLPLLRNMEVPEAERNLIQKAISQTFQSTAHLANLLPTGTVLAFQLLSPIFTNSGNCDSVSKSMTAALVALCGASCLLLSFTDSFRDNKGNICYGFATFRGLWIIDGSTTLPPQVAEFNLHRRPKPGISFPTNICLTKFQNSPGKNKAVSTRGEGRVLTNLKSSP